MNSPFMWILPLIFLCAAAAMSGFVDMPIQRAFFNPETGSFIKNGYTEFVAGTCGSRSYGACDWGVLPGQIAAGASVLLFLASYVRKNIKPWRKPALMLILTMAVGAGFITHTVLKDHWGRPRPKQVAEFGGKQAFRPIYKPNFWEQPEPSKSFPCGHCTMGFFFFAFFFLGKRLENPLLAHAGLFAALTLGAILAIARIMQGGHFFTDTLAAGIIMWLTALTIDWLLFDEED